MKIFLRAFLVCLFSQNLYSDDRNTVVLRAYVPPSISTQIITTQLTRSQSLVTFSSQMNSRFIEEQQKFEVEGLSQEGLSSTLKKSSNGRVVQYELLENYLRDSTSVEKPIFLKISAN